MALVYIPTPLAALTGGQSPVEVEGETVRQVIDNLERAWPGVRERLIVGNRLRPNISVAVDGEVTPLGLLEPVGAKSEVHFVAAISGGSLLTAAPGAAGGEARGSPRPPPPAAGRRWAEPARVHHR